MIKYTVRCAARARFVSIFDTPMQRFSTAYKCAAARCAVRRHVLCGEDAVRCAREISKSFILRARLDKKAGVLFAVLHNGC